MPRSNRLLWATLAFALLAALQWAQPAMGAPAGWEVEWTAERAAVGDWQQLSVDAGRIVYHTAEDAVVLRNAVAGTTVTLTAPGTRGAAPVIEGDWVAWLTLSSDQGIDGLLLHSLSGEDDRRIASGFVYGAPVLEGGRLLWLGGSNESVVLNLYDIAAGTNTALNEGTFGWSLPLLLSDRWVVWREHQADGSDLLFAYDTKAAEKHVYPEVQGGLYALLGDRVVVSAPVLPGESVAKGLALMDLRDRTFTRIPESEDGRISSLAADETAQRLAWTAMDEAGAFVAIYDLEAGSHERVPMPHHLLGPIKIAGDTVLFRAQAGYGLLSSAPMTLFAYDITDHHLTELGQLLRGLPFATDGTRAYWISTVLENDGWPRLPPHWFPESSSSIAASEHLFVGTAPAAEAEPFADISGTHLYRTAIVSLFEEGVVAGYESGGHAVFRPEETYLRAQYAKMLVEALDLTVDEGLRAPFWDLGPDDPDSLYPHDYIAAASEAGLIQGYPDGSFHPWQPAGRAQLVTLTVRAAQQIQPGLLLDTQSSYAPLPGNFDATHARSLAVAEDNGLMNGLLGYGREWDPWQAATRGEGAQLLWNLLRMDLRPSDTQLLQQAIAAITADQELTAEGRWSHGAASRPLTSADLDALRARLTSATLKAGRDRTWDPPTSEWGAILHTADGGRVGLDFWNETDAEMGWYSLALPSGQISTSERALVLEASQVAGWLRETLEASRVTADGEERPTPPAVAWIAPQAAAEKVPYQLWWARQAGGVG
mgnify:CR=1 FL=1